MKIETEQKQVWIESTYKIEHNFIDFPLQLNNFDIYQIGRIFCKKTSLCDNHFHSNWHEFTVITDGEGVIYTNNKPLTVKRGDIYFSFIYDIHKIQSSTTFPLKYDHFAFFPKDEMIKNKLISIKQSGLKTNEQCFHDEKIAFLISSAISEFNHFEPQTSEHLLDNILSQILIYTIRNLEKIAPKSQDLLKPDILCYQIMDYITNNIEIISSMSDLSKVFNYSYNHLSTIFKKSTNYTIIQYYNTVRLDKVRVLLETTKLTLNEICTKLNFATPYSLSNAFKKQFGLSPVNYKKYYIAENS